MLKNALFVSFLFISFTGFCQLNVDLFMYRGQDNLQKGEYKAALDDFNTLIRFNTDIEEAFYFRAVAKYFLGDYRGTIDDCTKAIELHPYISSMYSHFYLFRGGAKERLLDFQGAKNDYNKAVEVKPGNFEAIIRRGILAIIQDRFADAIPDFDKVILLNPKNSHAYMFRAIAKQSNGESEKALADFNRAVALDPKNDEVYMRRGSSRALLKDYKGALEDFDKAISLDSTNSYTYFCRALARQEILDYTGTMKDYDKVLELDPNNDITYYNRAELKAKVGDFKGAIEDYDHLARINPQNVYTYFNRAIMWHRLNNYRKAIDDYTRAINLYSNFATAYYNRSIARQAIKDFVGASNDNKIATKLNEKLKNLSQNGKIDSTNLAKLTEFKADFGNMGKDSSMAITFDPYKAIEINITKQQDGLVTVLATGKFKPSSDDRIVNLNHNFLKSVAFDLSIPEADKTTENQDHLAKILSDSLGNNPQASFMLANAIIRTKLQDYNGAINEYSLLLKSNPDMAMAYFCRANTRSEIVALMNSINNYGTSITIDANNKVKQSPKMSVNKREETEMVADLQKCIELEPTFPYAYYNMANIQIDNHDFTGAISNLTKAIEFGTKFGEAYYNKGIINLYLKEKEAGCSDLSKAGELGVEKAYAAIKNYCK